MFVILCLCYVYVMLCYVMLKLFLQRDSTAEEKFGDQGLKPASTITAVEVLLPAEKRAHGLGVLEGPIHLGGAWVSQVFLPLWGTLPSLTQTF